MLTCLSCHNFSNPIIVAFPVATLRFISLSHLPSFSTSDPRNVKLDTRRYFLSVYLKAVPVGCCHNLCLIKYQEQIDGWHPLPPLLIQMCATPCYVHFL